MATFGILVRTEEPQFKNGDEVILIALEHTSVQLFESGTCIGGGTNPDTGTDFFPAGHMSGQTVIVRNRNIPGRAKFINILIQTGFDPNGNPITYPNNMLKPMRAGAVGLVETYEAPGVTCISDSGGPNDPIELVRYLITF